MARTLQIALLTLAAAGAALAQRQVAAEVIDEAGKPLDGADVWPRSGPAAKPSGPDGRIMLDNTVAAVVVRKAGYESVRVRPPLRTEARVVLRRLPRPVFPVCGANGVQVGVDEWRSGRLRFRPLPDFDIGPPGADVDYVYRSYILRDRKTGMLHGAGPLWGPAWPRREQIETSTSFREVTYTDNQGTEVTDARGEIYGNYWRVLGPFGETVRYAGVDQATARKLDEFLDTACMRPWDPPGAATARKAGIGR